MQILRNGRGMSGAPQDLINGANGMLNAAASQSNVWPYWWREPRANSQYVQRVKTIPAPAVATPTEICRVDVPPGFVFIFNAYLQTFQSGIGGAPVFIDGSGDILWTIDVNQAVNAATLAGYGLPDLSNMAESRGSLANGPWPLDGYTVFNPYDILRLKVVTAAAITPGAPNFITGGLFGWFDKQL